MALVNKAIASLFNGISQQPASLRLPTQGELQENGHSSIVEGLRKRPPTKHIAKLLSSADADAAIHTINRDSTERYTVVISNGVLKVFDMGGGEKTVNLPSGTSYLATSTPYKDLTLLTVQDYTFLVNKTVTVQMTDEKAGNAGGGIGGFTMQKILPVAISGITSNLNTKATVTTSSAHNLQAGMVIEISGCSNTKFNGVITVTSVPSSTTFTYKPKAGTSVGWGSVGNTAGGSPVYTVRGCTISGATHGLSVGSVAALYGSSVPAYNGEWSVIAVMSSTSFAVNINTNGTEASSAVSLYTKSGLIGIVNRYAELPHQARDQYNSGATIWYWKNDVPLATPPATGDIWKIEGELSNNYTAYYVKYTGAAWQECANPGVLVSLDAYTMPWKLVREADGSFTLDVIDWANRLVGDDDTAPVPSFVGGHIQDIFFHRNRLGVISNEGVIMSRSGKFFNFFPKSVTLVRDDDPIDATIVSTKVATLRYAMSFNTNLLLFSDQSQFTLSARDVLTPKTANFNSTTEFEMSKGCRPVGAGEDVYFVVDRGGYSSLKEYYVQPMSYTFDAADITAHCPRYVPSGVFKLAVSTVEDCLFSLSRTERNTLYVYKFYWGDKDTKLQSSWSKWIFDTQDTLLNVDCIGTVLYLTISRADGIYLESIDLQSASADALGVLVHLDRKVTLTGSYNAGTNTTTWTLPYADTASNFQIVLGESYGTSAGLVLTPTRPTSTTLAVTGNWTAHPVYVGRQYTFRYRFSPQYYKDQEKAAVAHAQLMMRNMQVFFTGSGYFRAEVTPSYRETYTYPYSGRQLGSSDWVLGAIALGKGVFEFPLYADSDNIKIDLVNDSYLPSYFQSAEWEAHLSTRSKRI